MPSPDRGRHYYRQNSSTRAKSRDGSEERYDAIQHDPDDTVPVTVAKMAVNVTVKVNKSLIETINR
jgi:hypothetical protein